MEGGLPRGKNWHRELLNDMSIELRDIQPPVGGFMNFIERLSSSFDEG